MRILLTGATGFVGRNIWKSLIELPVLPKASVFGVGSKVWDLRSQRACKKLIEQIKPDVIVHAAGTVGGIGANKDNPGKFMYDNLIMGINLINESLLTKSTIYNSGPKFILLGTVCSYPKFTSIPFKEKDLWDGYPEETNAPYGIAKKTLMKLLETYYHQYGLNGVNLVPVNMYGPHDHFNLTTSHVIPAMILKVYNAMKNNDSHIVLWGTGRASREFLFAPDLGDAICKAILTDVGPEPINIGTGKEISIDELIKTIAEIMNYRGHIIYDGSKPDGQPRRCLDTSRAKEKLGFEAKTNLRTGLEQTIEWFLGEQ